MRRFIPLHVKRLIKGNFNRLKGCARHAVLFIRARLRKAGYAFMGSRLSYFHPGLIRARPAATGPDAFAPERLSSMFAPDVNFADIIRRLYNRHFPDRISPITARADLACENRMSFFEFENVHLGEKIGWHADIRSGKTWPAGTFYTDVRYFGFRGADVKVPWEMARFQHLIPLAKAFALTGDEKYARKFTTQVREWMDANPYPRGIHWACPMEIAIRAFNWLFIFSALARAGFSDPKFAPPFVKCLFLHGFHTIRNLEGTRRLRSNHYLSDLLGLLALGACMPRQGEVDTWLAKGVSALVEEMKSQVYPDGADFEGSTMYHCLVLELFTAGAVISRNAGLEPPPDFWKRLEKMFEFLHTLIKPTGELPQFGDNDSGRALNFTDAPPTDRRHILPIGAVLFNRPDWKTSHTPPSEDLLWLLGPDAFEEYVSWPVSPPPRAPAAFPDCGLYLIRDEHVYLLVSCGPNGQNGGGGHAHNDKLSFELNVRGTDVFVDPGTYLYTPFPEWRNTFRSTRIHNTVCVDGDEQNRFVEGSLFWMVEDTHPKCLRFEATDSEQVFEGEHDGYARLADPVTHRRAIRYSPANREILIHDALIASGAHSCEASFHLHPALRAVVAGPAVEIFRENTPVLTLASEDGLTASVEESWYSPGYGRRERTQAIRFRRDIRGPAEMTFRLRFPEDDYVETP